MATSVGYDITAQFVPIGDRLMDRQSCELRCTKARQWRHLIRYFSVAMEIYAAVLVLDKNV